jgi:hypothetical protein
MFEAQDIDVEINARCDVVHVQNQMIDVGHSYLVA